MTRIACCSITAAGAELATRLPFEHHHGRLVDTVRELWTEVDGFVLVAATGVAVRAIAPLLADKRTDPGVVCVDDAGGFAVALTGGHAGGANALAREVAALLGAAAVVTTATATATTGAGRRVPALDDLPGFRAAGDLASVTRRWLDGDPPQLGADPVLGDWPRPAVLADIAAGRTPGGRVTITDAARPAARGEVLLRPASIVLGVGASTGADEGALWDLAQAALAGAGIDPAAVGAVATLDRKTGEPAIVALARRLAVPLTGFSASTLAAVAVPHPSQVVAAAVGTPSVAEAAALHAAGSEASLVAGKAVSGTGDSTLAVARRRRPAGHLAVVGLGPGHPSRRTPEASAAVRHAEVVIGYGPYVDLTADVLRPAQEHLRSPIGAEMERCTEALRRAAAGQRVALVCSGDPGVYAMASLVLELAPAFGDPPVDVIPGVTAALSGAALLGAPLGHDHAAISLSDLLTPWPAIVARLEAVAAADFVVSLYNPRSARRTTQLTDALAILTRHRPPSTPAAVLTDIGRPAETVVRTTLSDLDPEKVTMLSLVVIGSTQTRWISGRMVTPRGYPAHAAAPPA